MDLHLFHRLRCDGHSTAAPEYIDHADSLNAVSDFALTSPPDREEGLAEWINSLGNDARLYEYRRVDSTCRQKKSLSIVCTTFVASSAFGGRAAILRTESIAAPYGEI
jgi:hypothetical protein